MAELRALFLTFEQDRDRWLCVTPQYADRIELRPDHLDSDIGGWTVVIDGDPVCEMILTADQAAWHAAAFALMEVADDLHADTRAERDQARAKLNWLNEGVAGE